MAVWAITPMVENPATRKVWVEPQVSSVCGLAALAPNDPDEHAEAGDRDDVVQDRRPHRGPERAVGVEHLGQQGVQAVEEDLRKAPEREGHREGLLLRRVALRRQLNDPRRQQRHRQRECQQHQHRKRQQPADVVRTLVRSLARLDDLGHQDGVEDAAGHQQEDQVRQVVRVDERVVDGGAQAEGGRQHPGLGEAQETRDQRSGGHDGAGTDFSGLDSFGIGGAGVCWGGFG